MPTRAVVFTEAELSLIARAFELGAQWEESLWQCVPEEDEKLSRELEESAKRMRAVGSKVVRYLRRWSGRLSE